MQALNPDKKTIGNNFYKSRFLYEENALIQKKMAEKLTSFLAPSYDNILEIGIGTGSLTKLVYASCRFKYYYAIDIIKENKNFLETRFPRLSYACFDMDNIKNYYPAQQFDLIISNAAIQWSNNQKVLIQNCLNRLSPDGTLALAFFGEKNFYEIKDIFGVGLTYLNPKDIYALCSNYTVIHYSEETEELQFPDTISLLRHIKNTGVGGMSHTVLKKEQLKQYTNKFHNILTYNPVYCILKKAS